MRWLAGEGARRLTERVLVPALLAGLVSYQARLVRESTCETFDETIYMKVGFLVCRDGVFRALASPMTPPLPILLEYGPPALRSRALPDRPGWEEAVPGLTRQARLMTATLVGVPLAWLVYGWIARRRGWPAGALAGGLVATSPTVLASASIATTDACFGLFGVLALMAIHRYQVRPGRWSFRLMGVALGLALASKQTAVILFPVALVELLLKAPGRRPGDTWVDAGLRVLFVVGGRLAALIAIAFVADWAAHGFAFGPNFGTGNPNAYLPVVVPMAVALLPDGESIMNMIREWGPPLPIDTLMGQLNHASTGHPAFLMGRYSAEGWWYFFPVAMAIKSTPAELVAFGLSGLLALRWRTWLDPARRLWLLTLAALIGAGMASRLNIGHRYMLLAYPLAAMLAADAIGALGASRPRRAATIGALLLAWQGVSAASIAPHYLGYFNSVCGGPSEGYRYLVDSSLDWGQDLPLLRRSLEARGYRRVALAYFGTALPRVYGLRGVDFMDKDAPDCDWLAVSASSLQDVYGGGTGALRRHFLTLPATRVGYSFFLYDLSDPRVRAALMAVQGRGE